MGLERLVVPIEWKAADDDQTLEGFASTFGNVDLQGDIVVKGAFKKTIANIKANGIPLLADHIPSTAHVLGTIFDAEERDKGLWIKAKLSKAPSAQDTRTKLIEGHLKKMSIGYETMDHAFEDTKDGQRVRLLKELKLWETSVVVMPANPAATISRVKSVVAELGDDDRKALIHEIASPQDIETADPTYRSEVESKATVNEIRQQLATALRNDVSMNKDRWRWIRDFDASHVWFEDESPAESAIFEQTYSVSASGGVTLTGEPVKVRAVTTYIPVDETGAKNAPADEAEAKAAPTAPVADEAAPPPDEGASGWDRWSSEALLADRDPQAIADSAHVAGLAKRLELFEDFLKQADAPRPVATRAELSERLASLESSSDVESVPSR
ncbi:HK97 family phage prohead protease [Amycolatopsis palatopharyngis]|uniref:HK97 family phage prohead protease n=1 Tax=Amycolatopsis palatopharyngis TaxID=187982 RepID=UPI0013BE9A99|nr:HK97 family phage prohead protease [Amycolatopsis palatopharyngis]